MDNVCAAYDNWFPVPSAANWYPGDPDTSADPMLSYYELVRPSSMYDGGAAKCAYGCMDPTATNYEAGAEEDDGSCVNYCTSDWVSINQATEYRCLKRTTGFERYVNDDLDCPSYCTLGGPGISPYLGVDSRQFEDRLDTTGMCVYTEADQQCMANGLAVYCTCDINSDFPCRPSLPQLPQECSVLPECCDPDGSCTDEDDAWCYGAGGPSASGVTEPDIPAPGFAGRFFCSHDAGSEFPCPNDINGQPFDDLRCRQQVCSEEHHAVLDPGSSNYFYGGIQGTRASVWQSTCAFVPGVVGEAIPDDFDCNAGCASLALTWEDGCGALRAGISAQEAEQVDKLIQHCQGKAMVTVLKRDCGVDAAAACNGFGTCWPEFLNLYENYFEACENVVGGWQWYETCSSRSAFGVNVVGTITSDASNAGGQAAMDGIERCARALTPGKLSVINAVAECPAEPVYPEQCQLALECTDWGAVCGGESPISFANAGSQPNEIYGLMEYATFTRTKLDGTEENKPITCNIDCAKAVNKWENNCRDWAPDIGDVLTSQRKARMLAFSNACTQQMSASYTDISCKAQKEACADDIQKDGCGEYVTKRMTDHYRDCVSIGTDGLSHDNCSYVPMTTGVYPSLILVDNVRLCGWCSDRAQQNSNDCTANGAASADGSAAVWTVATDHCLTNSGAEVEAREWLRCIGANGTDDSGLSIPVLMSRKSLHQQVFPYQMDSCHAALDLFGNYSAHSRDQPHDDTAQLDSAKFRCVADFTRIEDEKSAPGVEAAHGQVYLSNTTEADLATAYGHCRISPPRPPSYDKLQYCPAKTGHATFQEVSGPLTVTPQRFLNEAMEYRCSTVSTHTPVTPPPPHLCTEYK